MPSTITYDQAKRHVERKIGFLIHLGAFVTANSGLLLLNLQLGHGNWAVWPLLGWSVGLFFHGLSVTTRAPGNRWKQRMIRHELNKHS